jgi:hypothetical protein
LTYGKFLGVSVEIDTTALATVAGVNVSTAASVLPHRSTSSAVTWAATCSIHAV